MNHLNIFNPYKHKSNYHEDELSRAFLIMVKKIPIIQNIFISMVREEMIKLNCNKIIEPYFQEEASVVYVDTQIANSNDIFKQAIDRRLVSIVISDDKLNTDTTVTKSKRNARYDGVILYDPSWILIIENKPSVKNIWIEQLNPNVDENIEVEENVIALSWRDIIKKINSLFQKELLAGLEKELVLDFVEYVDAEFEELNPFTTFAVCKNSMYLLERRCISIMNEMCMGDVGKHAGWKHCINVRNEVISKIALYPVVKNGSWEIVLDISAGPIMTKARVYYKKLDLNKFNQLQKEGWQLKPDYHFSFRSDNQMFFKINCSPQEYVKHFKDNINNIKQVAKEEILPYCNDMVSKGIFYPFNEKILLDGMLSKNHSKFNQCPSLSYIFIWDKDTVTSLDSNHSFVEEVRRKISQVLNSW